MTKQETAKVMAYLREAYPQGAQITQNTINVWHDVLGEYPYQVAWEAARQVAGEWVGYTMPPASTIKQKIKQMMPNDQTGIELWRTAEKAIKRGTRMTQEEFDQLPEPVRLYFGGVSALKDLALLDKSQLPNERARFLNNVNAIQSRIETRRAAGPALEGIKGLLE